MGWRWVGDGLEMGWRWVGDGLEMGWRWGWGSGVGSKWSAAVPSALRKSSPSRSSSRIISSSCVISSSGHAGSPRSPPGAASERPGGVAVGGAGLALGFAFFRWIDASRSGRLRPGCRVRVVRAITRVSAWSMREGGGRVMRHWQSARWLGGWWRTLAGSRDASTRRGPSS